MGYNFRISGSTFQHSPENPTQLVEHQAKIEPRSRFLCRKTPDGSAYPLDVPWGNMGAITNGLCITAIAEKYSVDPDNSERNRCFMQRQLGYVTLSTCAYHDAVGASSKIRNM